MLTLKCVEHQQRIIAYIHLGCAYLSLRFIKQFLNRIHEKRKLILQLKGELAMHIDQARHLQLDAIFDEESIPVELRMLMWQFVGPVELKDHVFRPWI